MTFLFHIELKDYIYKCTFALMYACDWGPCVCDYMYKWMYGCGPLTFQWQESLHCQTSIRPVEINEDHPDEDKQNYFFIFSKLEMWESFLVEKREGFG